MNFYSFSLQGEITKKTRFFERDQENGPNSLGVALLQVQFGACNMGQIFLVHEVSGAHPTF